MSESTSAWVGNRQWAETFRLRRCPICGCEAQHLIGLRYSCINLGIYVHYDENSEVMAVHVVSAYRRTLYPFAYQQNSEWSEPTR